MSSGADRTSRLVLDTSAYAQLRRGHDGVLTRIASAEHVLVPVVVLGELEAGFLQGRRSRENRAVLDEFLAEPFVGTLDLTRRVSRRYGVLVRNLRRAGTPIPTNDLWIAACTEDVGGHLLTFDRHFERIPSLSRTVLDAMERR